MLSKTVSFQLVFCPGGPRTWDIGRDIWVGRGHCNSVGGPPSPGVCGEYNGWRQWPAAPGLLGHSILSLSGLMMWSRLMENITTCLQQSLYYTKNCGIYVVWRFFSEETRTQSCRVARSEWYKCLTLCIGGWFSIIADLLDHFDGRCLDIFVRKFRQGIWYDMTVISKTKHFIYFSEYWYQNEVVLEYRKFCAAWIIYRKALN